MQSGTHRLCKVVRQARLLHANSSARTHRARDLQLPLQSRRAPVLCSFLTKAGMFCSSFCSCFFCPQVVFPPRIGAILPELAGTGASCTRRLARHAVAHVAGQLTVCSYSGVDYDLA